MLQRQIFYGFNRTDNIRTSCREGTYTNAAGETHSVMWTINNEKYQHLPVPYKAISDPTNFAELAHSINMGAVCKTNPKHSFIQSELRIEVHNNDINPITTALTHAFATLLPTLLNFTRNFTKIMVYTNGDDGYNIWVYDNTALDLYGHENNTAVFSEIDDYHTFQFSRKLTTDILSPIGIYNAASRVNPTNRSLLHLQKAIAFQLEQVQKFITNNNGEPLRYTIPQSQPDDENNVVFLPQWIMDYSLLYIETTPSADKTNRRHDMGTRHPGEPAHETTGEATVALQNDGRTKHRRADHENTLVTTRLTRLTTRSDNPNELHRETSHLYTVTGTTVPSTTNHHEKCTSHTEPRNQRGGRRTKHAARRRWTPATD